MLLSLSGSRHAALPAWWQGYTSVLAGAFLEYLAVEEYASQILSYSPTLIPELLQSEDYAFALAAGDENTPPGTEEQFAEALCTRQQVILQSGRINLSVVLGETALRQQLGDHQLMRDQLRRMIDLSTGTSWIRMQVLPFSAGMPGIINCGSLSILRFPALPTVGLVHVGGPNGGVCLEQSQDVAAYARAFQQAQTTALSPAASRTFIMQMAEP